MTLPLVTSVLAVVADQVTKHLARTTMVPHESIPVLGSFFRLTYVENSGIAFGINFRGGPVIFTVTSVVATLVVIGYAWKYRHRELSLRLSLALIAGGAVGNVIDRLLFGKVVDFLDFSFGAFHWPVFNVADSCVTVGIILFLYHSFFGPTTSA
ncbi:MAG: signal peptidase II [Fidelibacterota bacterium]